jgi:hypothetical protein
MITSRQHNVHKIEAQGLFLIITSGDFQLQVPFENLSERLKNASELERQIFSMSTSGYGIHWPLIDEDLAIEQIIRDFGS